MRDPQFSADAMEQARSRLKARLAAVTAQIHSRPLDGALDEWLNTNLGADTATYLELKEFCAEGVAQGWLCKYEGGGYGKHRWSAPCAPTGRD